MPVVVALYISNADKQSAKAFQIDLEHYFHRG